MPGPEVPVSEKKPPGVSWESFIERQIREATERGDFDNLPGAGAPIPDLNRPRDDMWWVREKLRREEVSYLPASLQLRKQVEDAREAIDRARSEVEVRSIVAAVNERIVAVNRTGGSGPPSALMPLDADAMVERWRARFSEGTAG